jgi:hypothetical protein
MSFSLNDGLDNVRLGLDDIKKPKVRRKAQQIVDTVASVNQKLIKATRLPRGAKKFIENGEKTYENGPWDNNDLGAMYAHGDYAGALQTGYVRTTPKCDTCGKIVVPTGMDVANNTIWGHMPTSATSQTQISSNGKVSGGFGHLDRVDNENHDATFNEDNVKVNSIPGRFFKDRRAETSEAIMLRHKNGDTIKNNRQRIRKNR